MEPNQPKDKPGTSLVVLDDVRKRKAEEEAPFEAVEPQSTLIQGDDWLVTACDGEQHYVFVVSRAARGKRRFRVTEVYPGLSKRRTALRDAKEPKDLVFQAHFDSQEEAVEEIAEVLLGDLELDETGTDE